MNSPSSPSVGEEAIGQAGSIVVKRTGGQAAMCKGQRGPKHVRIVEGDAKPATSSTRPTARSQRQSEAPDRGLLPTGTCSSSSTRPHRSHLEVEARPLSGQFASRDRARKLNARLRERARIEAEARQPEALELSLAKDRRRRRVSRFSGYDPISLITAFFHDPVLRFWFGCNFCFAVTLYGGAVLFLILVYPSLRPLTQY